MNVRPEYPLQHPRASKYALEVCIVIIFLYVIIL